MKRLTLVLTLALCSMASLFAQTRSISGKVQDNSGESLIGATVLAKGTTVGTVTDFDGNFSINLPPEANVLVFSYTGYQTQEMEVGSATVLNIVLSTEDVLLNEIVVVGYNSVKKSDLTSSISKVSGDELIAQPIGSIDNLLQGHSTGLQAVAQNGRPGGQAYIRIRGVGSVNASNEPLFIVDGVQVTPNDYNALNPNDVKEVSVLKDAGATSIYGSRASNGVILITTKKGSANTKPKIEYSAQYGQKEMVDIGFEMMNGTQKLDYEVALGARSPESAAALKANLGFLETNWRDVLLRTGNVRSHNFSINGGNNLANYYFSLSYYDEDGISIASDFNRITGRLNMDFQVTDWLKIGNTLNISQTDENELRDRFNVQNPFYAFLGYNPYETEFQLDGQGNLVLDENGDPRYNLTSQGFSISEAVRKNPEDNKRTNAIGSFYAEAAIAPGLTAKTQMGGNYQIFRREYYIYPGSILDGYIGDPNAPGSKTDNGSDQFIFNWTNTIAYNKTFGELHNFGALLGTEYFKQSLSSFRLDGKGFPSSQFTTQDNAAAITGGNTALTEWALWSQFGELRYNYNSKYYATFSLRRDGSSRFGSDNQNGLFYAGSLAWNINNEAFFGSTSVVDQLKLRISAGTSGNEPTNLYWQGTYGFGSYIDQTASFPNQLSNETIKWEENFNYSIGLDFGLFNNRLSGSLDYYSRRTYDLLFPKPLSATTGWASRLANVGEMNNSGIEFELIGDVIRKNGLTVSLFGSISTNKNKITKLDNNGEDIINAASGVSLLREGLPVNTYYLVRYVGVDPATGDQLFLDLDGNVTNKHSDDYAVAIEDKAPQPKYFGSFGLKANYKGLDFNANFYYSGGNYVYNYMMAVLESDGANININQSIDALNYWKQPGDTDVLPRPDITANTLNSDRYLQKGDYMRLRNITMGYSLPTKLLNKAAIQRLRLFVQATNLYTYNPYFKGDPEVGRGNEDSNLLLAGEFTLFTYPQTMGWTVGLNVTF
ncbi:MAG: TonB-dependent receptor [Saprospiraceae bacterium]